MHMSHDSNSNTGKGPLADLQAYIKTKLSITVVIRMNFECLIMTDKKIRKRLERVLPKSFIRWAFSRDNSCADPGGDKEHERVKRGIGARTPPPLENDKLYGFL